MKKWQAEGQLQPLTSQFAHTSVDIGHTGGDAVEEATEVDIPQET